MIELSVPVKNGEVKLGDKVRWERSRCGYPADARGPREGEVIEIVQRQVPQWRKPEDRVVRTCIGVRTDPYPNWWDKRTKTHSYVTLTKFERIEKVT